MPEVASVAEPVSVTPFAIAGASGSSVAVAGGVLSTVIVRGAEGALVLPVASVTITRTSYWPSGYEPPVVSHATLQPPAALESVPTVVHVFAPCGETWNCAEATPLPEPSDASSEASATLVPRTSAAAAGAVTVPAGAVLSTVTLVGADGAATLPALSRSVTRRSYWPSGYEPPVVFQLTLQPPAELESVPSDVHVFAPWGETSNVADATPLPLSVASPETTATDEPPTKPVGAVTLPVGGWFSAVTVVSVDVEVLPTPSVSTTRRSYWPSASADVSHGTFQPPAELESVPIVVHVLVPCGAYWKAAEARPLPPVSAASADATVTPAPPTKPPFAGEVTVPDGAELSTLTVVTGELDWTFPAASVATMRRSYCPSERPVVSQLVFQPPAALESVPMVVHVPAPCGERWNATDATPLAPEPGSLTSPDETVTVAWTKPPLGEVTDPVGFVLSTPTVVTGETVCTFPTASVATIRRSYCPSERPVVSQAVFQPPAALESVPIVVHVPAPCGERWNATEATPLPEPSLTSLDETVTLEPETKEPPAGVVTEPVGGALSTLTAVSAGEACVFPAASVTITRRSYEPSATEVESHVAVQPPAGLVSVAMVDHEPARCGETWNAAEATSVLSLASAEASATALPWSVVPAVGVVTEPVGFVLSTVTVTSDDVVALPAASVVTTRRSYCPSASDVVSHVTFQPPAALESVPIVVHVFAPCGERWNAAEATPEPPVSAESEETITDEPATYAPALGAVTEPVGAFASTITVALAPDVAWFPTLSESFER